MRKIITILIVLFLFSGTASAGSGMISLSIPCTVVSKGTLPDPPEKITYLLQENISGEYIPFMELSVSPDMESVTEKFPDLVYDTPGIHQYLLSQVPGNRDCQYDDSVFTVKVAVYSTEDGLGKEVTVFKNHDLKKYPDMPIFTNFYKEKVLETELPEGMGQGKPSIQQDDGRNIAGQPKTGDDSPVEIYSLCAFASLFAFIILSQKKGEKGKGDHPAGPV